MLVMERFTMGALALLAASNLQFVVVKFSLALPFCASTSISNLIALMQYTHYIGSLRILDYV